MRFSSCESVALVVLLFANSLQFVDADCISCTTCGTGTNITISSNVASLANGAFSTLLCGGSCLLTSVTIPTTITALADSVFYGCANLVHVNIPTSISKLGISVFQKCFSLPSLVIPTSVTAISDVFCAYCTNLNSVSLPPTLQSIGKFAFYYSSSLTTISMPNTVSKIGNYAFQGCVSLAGSIAVPSGLTPATVGLQIFQYNHRITLSIPSSISSFVYPALLDCSLFNILDIPNTVTRVGNSSFLNCTSLQTIIVPNSVVIIGDNAFAQSINVVCVIGTGPGLPGVSPS